MDPFDALDGPLGHYYDKEGRPISYREYARLKYETEDYPHIAEDHLGTTWVSTVWLGINHNYSPRGKPLIFETMIFGGPLDLETWRYYTEEEARMAHRHIKRFARDVARMQRRRRYKKRR